MAGASLAAMISSGNDRGAFFFGAVRGLFMALPSSSDAMIHLYLCSSAKPIGKPVSRADVAKESQNNDALGQGFYGAAACPRYVRDAGLGRSMRSVLGNDGSALAPEWRGSGVR